MLLPSFYITFITYSSSETKAGYYTIPWSAGGLPLLHKYTPSSPCPLNNAAFLGVAWFFAACKTIYVMSPAILLTLRYDCIRVHYFPFFLVGFFWWILGLLQDLENMKLLETSRTSKCPMYLKASRYVMFLFVYWIFPSIFRNDWQILIVSSCFYLSYFYCSISYGSKTKKK